MLNIPNGVRKLLRQDNVLKNVRISFPNGEKSDICNDRLVRESLKFDESVSSREEIQFGLCESSVLSFECVDVGNIKGLEIAAAIEIDVSSAINQSHKASPYTPVILKGHHDGQEVYVLVTDMFMGDDGDEYLSADNSRMNWGFHSMPTFPPSTLAYTEDMSLDYFRDVVGLDPRGTKADWYDGLKGGGYAKMVVYSVADDKFYPCGPYTWTGSFRRVDGLELMPIGATTEGAFTDADLVAELGGISFDAESIAYYSTDAEVEAAAETAEDVPFPFYSIPLGRFIVDECKRDASLRMRKVTAQSKDFSLPVKGWFRTLTECLSQVSYWDVKVLSCVLGINPSLFDESQLEYTTVHVDSARKRVTGSDVVISEWTAESSGTNYDWRFVLSTHGYYFNVSSYPSTYPQNVRLPMKCTNNGITDLSRESLYNQYDTFIQTTLQYWTIPDDAIAAGKLALKNLLYPHPALLTPYAAKRDFEIEVGDIYLGEKTYVNETDDPFFRYLDEIDIRIYRRVHGTTNYDLLVHETLNNFVDESAIEYKYVNNLDDLFPDYPIRLLGEPVGNQYDYLQAWTNLDMRDAVIDCLELNGSFGRFNRYGFFEAIQIPYIDPIGLFPDPGIYPDNNLYPTPFMGFNGDDEHLIVLDSDDVMSLWYEEYYVKFGRIIVTYLSSEVLDEDNNPMPVTYSYEWNADSAALSYELNQNETLLSVAHTDAQVRDLIAPLIAVLQNLQFCPSDAQHVGLPYMEAGDWELISIRDNKVLALVLSRTMSGIQLLTDKIKSD